MNRNQIVRIRNSEGFDGQYGVITTESTAGCTVKLPGDRSETFELSQLVTEQMAGGDWNPPQEVMNLSHEMQSAAA